MRQGTHLAATTQFATTQWTVVCAAALGGDTLAVDALGQLFATYWPPLYRYARRRGKSPEDAEDLIQGFFTHLITEQGLRATDPAKGRFRAWVLASFNHWMINTWKQSTRQKRGGGIPALSLDWRHAETGLGLEIASHRAPEYWFTREWAVTLLAKVLSELEAQCVAEGGEASFAVLKGCLSADSARIPYLNLSTKLGLTEGATRVAVHRLRKRYRALLHAEISRTLEPGGTVEEEVRALFTALAD